MSTVRTTSLRPRLQLFALDCPDPLALGAFYSRLTGLAVEPLGDVTPGDVSWLELVSDGGPTLAFQKIDNYRAPTWPEAGIPAQAHLDFVVDDLDTGESFALDAGAVKCAHQPGTTFRVFLDPVGHPFCLVQGRPGECAPVATGEGGPVG